MSRSTGVTRPAALCLAALVGLLVAGCGVGADDPATPPPPTATDAPRARLVLSRDLGTVPVEPARDIAPGQSVLDATRSLEDVRVEGGFVQAIGGLTGSRTSPPLRDWFVSVNGLEANAGATQLDVRDGDVVRWDYHAWSYEQTGLPGEVADLPEPFRHGYRGRRMPLRVEASAGLEDAAAALATALGGETVTAAQVVAPAAAPRAAYRIRVVADRSGPDHGPVRVGADGPVRARPRAATSLVEVPSAVAAASLEVPAGPTGPVTLWVSGLDARAARAAARALAMGPPPGFYGLWDAAGRLVPVP